MKIAVVGGGYVGLVTAAGFATHGHDVTVIDNSAKRLADLIDGKVPFHEPGLPELLERHRERIAYANGSIAGFEIVFVCVGTPVEDLGAADLSAVEDVVSAIHQHGDHKQLVVIKSTVPPGTAAGLQKRYPTLRIASNPEFLAEGTAVEDCLRPVKIVIGGDAPELDQLYGVYGARGPRGIILSQIDHMTTTEAELTKYASNYLLAARVSLVNELAQLASAIGADVTKVLMAVGKDPRIGHHFLRPGIGFGGSCFKKDVSALYYEGQRLDLSMPLARAILDVNDRQRAQAASFITTLAKRAGEGAKVAVLGLAFKPGTDDLRDAPAVSIIHRLLADGIEVWAHDPVVQASQWPRPFRPGAKINFLPVTTAQNPATAIVQLAHVVLLCTEWPVYREIDWTLAKPGTHVVDGRNFLDRGPIEKAGLFYHGVGRPSTPGAFR